MQSPPSSSTAQASPSGTAGSSTTSPVVTGEAVVLDLHAATFISRGAAWLIDGLICVAVMFLLGFLVPVEGAMATVISVVGFVLLALGWEAVTRGKSPGKYALGLRVVRDDGGVIRGRHATARALTGAFELWMTLGAVAIVTSILNQKGKRLGDMVAGTYVINERLPKLPAPLPPVPEQLREWTQIADIGQIPDGLANAAARFLRQAGKMSPSHRENIARSLASEIWPYVSPQPPHNTPPELYLTAVLAQRRERDYQILQRRRQAAHARAERLNRL